LEKFPFCAELSLRQAAAQCCNVSVHFRSWNGGNWLYAAPIPVKGLFFLEQILPLLMKFFYVLRACSIERAPD